MWKVWEEFLLDGCMALLTENDDVPTGPTSNQANPKYTL
jgi:hypothetical protein